MSLKYTDLIASNKVQDSLFNQEPYKSYVIHKKHDHWFPFISFKPHLKDKTLAKAYAKNWKMRLSIHPKDLDKAWDIISPILFKNKVNFKIPYNPLIKESRKEKRQCLKKLLNEFNSYKDSYSQQIFSLTTLRRTYRNISRREFYQGQWRFLPTLQKYYNRFLLFIQSNFLSKQRLFELTCLKYKKLIQRQKQKTAASSRFLNGMQFTIYLLPGAEQQHQQILEEIELRLLEKQIRPGKICLPDRQLGIYTSIRHPGKDSYHPASSVPNYNPDNIKDPFGFLSTISKTNILQDSECNTILHASNVGYQITQCLNSKKLIPPPLLKKLAFHKEDVLNYIKSRPPKEKLKLAQKGMDNTQVLGLFFLVQRGMFTPQYGSGTMQKLENIVEKSYKTI